MGTFGDEIRALLQKSNISTRKVDSSSRHEAHAKHNGALYVSRYRLHQLEKNADDATIAELAALAKLCHITLADIVDRYLSYYPSLVHRSEHLASTTLLQDQESARFFFEHLTPASNETKLLTGATNDFSPSLLRRLWPYEPQYMYGRIGLNDWMMWPLLRPGCLVRINTRQKMIARHDLSNNDYDRPIYFLEIRGGFTCGWCYLNDRQLIVAPHSHSPVSPRSYIIGRDAEVRGRVVGYVLDCESSHEN